MLPDISSQLSQGVPTAEKEAKLRQLQVSRVLKKLGFYSLGEPGSSERDKAANLLLGYLATLHERYRHTVTFNKPIHKKAYERFDRFFTKHRQVFKKPICEGDVAPLKPLFSKKLDTAPLGALLRITNTHTGISQESWERLKYWASYASICFLMCHFRYIDVNNKSVLMPAISSGLRRLRLSQEGSRYQMVLHELSVPSNFSEFCEQWNKLYETVNTKHNDNNEQLSKTVAGQNFNTLKLFFEKFWHVTPSKPLDYTTGRSKVTRSQTLDKPSRGSVERIQPAIRHRNIDKQQGEEVAVEQRTNYQVLETDAKHTSEYRSQLYLQHVKANAIAAASIRNELGHPCSVNTIDRGHLVQLLSKLSFADDSEFCLEDTFLLFILITGQTHKTLLPALKHKKSEKNDLTISLSPKAITFTNNRKLTSHLVAHQVGLVDGQKNLLRIELPFPVTILLRQMRKKLEMISEKQLNDRLRRLCSQLNIPPLVSNQLAAWPFLHLARRAKNRTAVAAVFGMQPSEWTPLYYTYFDVSKLRWMHSKFYEALFNAAGHGAVANLFLELSEYSKDIAGSYGSTLRIRQKRVKKVLSNFRNYISELKHAYGSGERSYFRDLHNAYTVYVVLYLQLQTGARPVSGVVDSIGQIDFSNKRIFLQDKEVRDGFSRIIPMTNGLEKQLRSYVEYLAVANRELVSKGSRLSEEFLAQLKCKEGLFKIFKKEFGGQWRYGVLTNGLLADYLKDMLPLPLNFARHMVRNFLNHQDVSTEIIDDFMGHDIEGQMIHGKYSAHIESDAVALKSALEVFANGLSLEHVQSPIVPFDKEILLCKHSGLPTTVAQEVIDKRERLTEREKRVRAKIKREEKIRSYLHGFIEHELPELRNCEGSDEDLNKMILKAHQHVESKFMGSDYYIAKEELVSFVDRLNSTFNRVLNIGKLPTKIARETPLRTMLSVNLADRSARVSELLLRQRFSIDNLSDLEIRCLLTLVSGLYGGLNSPSWLVNLMNFDFSTGAKVFSSSVFDKVRLYWLTLELRQSHAVNDIQSNDRGVLSRQLFLNALQLPLVTALLTRKSKPSRLKLSDIPAVLKNSDSLCEVAAPMYYESQKQAPIVQMFKFMSDFAAQHSPELSVALRHTAMGKTETFCLPNKQFAYAIHPHLNHVEEAPSIERLQVVRGNEEDALPAGKSKRAVLKQSLKGESRNVNRELNRILKLHQKNHSESKVVISLLELKNEFEHIEAVSFLLAWFIHNMEFKRNRVSTVRRYHSEVTLNWLVATFEHADLSSLSGEDFYELYSDAVELTQPRTEDDIEILAGEGTAVSKPDLMSLETKEEKAKEKQRNKERHAEQIARNKKKISKRNYTRQCFQRFHNFLVEHFQLPRMPRDLVTMQRKDVEHIRVGFIPCKLYEAVKAKLPETKGCDETTALMLQCITVLAYRTGMRLGEILSLRLDDITNPPKIWLRIRDNQYAKVKRVASKRKLPLFSLLEPEELSLFKAWWMRRKRHSRTSAELLFCYQETPQMLIDTWTVKQSIVAWLRALSGIKRFVFHDFRHTAISCLQFLLEDEDELYCKLSGRDGCDTKLLKDSLFGGVNVRVDRYYALATLAGHSDPSATFKSYMHFSYLISHLKLRKSHLEIPKSFASSISGLTLKKVGHIKQKGKRNLELEANTKSLNQSVSQEGLIEAVLGSSKRHLKEVKQQPSVTIECASGLMTVKPGPAEVHDILLCVAKGMSNDQISQDYDVPVSAVECYREAARYLLEKRTIRSNRRLVTKRANEKRTYLPEKPLTPSERRIARRYINGIIERIADEKSIGDFRKVVTYFTNNVHAGEPGIRFKSADKLNWFVEQLQPVISLRNWYIFVTTSKSYQLALDDFINRLKITTRKPEVKYRDAGKPDFYLRLKHPNQDDLRRKGSRYQSTSMLKYVFSMVVIILSAQNEFD